MKKIYKISLVLMILLSIVSMSIQQVNASSSTFGDFFIVKWIKNMFDGNNKITGNAPANVNMCLHREDTTPCVDNNQYGFCIDKSCDVGICSDTQECLDKNNYWSGSQSCGAQNGKTHACSHSTLHGCCAQHSYRVKSSGTDVCCVCNQGWGDCDGDINNGCEKNVLNDGDNCGSCGHKCGNDEYCDNGVCKTTSTCSHEDGTCNTNNDCCANEGLTCVEATQGYPDEDPFFNTHNKNIGICKKIVETVDNSVGDCPDGYVINTNVIQGLCINGCEHLDADSYRKERDLNTNTWVIRQTNTYLGIGCLAKPGYSYNDEKGNNEIDTKLDDTHLRKYFLDGCNWCDDRFTYKDYKCPNNLKVKEKTLTIGFNDNRAIAYCPTECKVDNDCVNPIMDEGRQTDSYCASGHCCPKGKVWDGSVCIESNRCSDPQGTGGWVFRVNGGKACCFNMGNPDVIGDNNEQYDCTREGLQKCFRNFNNLNKKYESWNSNNRPYKNVCYYISGEQNCEGHKECGKLGEVELI